MLVAAALAVAGCGGGGSAPSNATAEIVDVDGIEPVREQFNRDRGSPRLLVLFSPT